MSNTMTIKTFPIFAVNGETFTDVSNRERCSSAWESPKGYVYPSLAEAASAFFGLDVNVHEAISRES